MCEKNKPTLKILQIIIKLNTGGAEVLVVNLAHQLIKKGYICDICSLDSEGNLVEEARKKGIRVWSLDRREGSVDWRLVKRLYFLMRKRSYDIIHTHNFPPNLYGAPLAKLAGVRGTIYTQHGVMAFPCSRKRLRALKVLSWFTDRWVTVSQSVKKDIMKYTGISDNKIITIINGIDTGIFLTSKNYVLKEKLGLSEYEFVIGTVGRLSPEKDHETLLKAFKLLSNRVDKACLVIVGDGSQKAYLETLIQDMKLSSKVFLLGDRRDIPDILGTFDIFVNSSISEGIPLTILEAMACGLPVVATRVGGIPEIIIDGLTGFMVPSQNETAISDAIFSLYLEPQKLQQMGLAGRRRAEQHFSLETLTERYLSEYHRIIG